jgi:hypothetical protein
VHGFNGTRIYADHADLNGNDGALAAASEPGDRQPGGARLVEG